MHALTLRLSLVLFALVQLVLQPLGGVAWCALMGVADGGCCCVAASEEPREVPSCCSSDEPRSEPVGEGEASDCDCAAPGEEPCEWTPELRQVPDPGAPMGAAITWALPAPLRRVFDARRALSQPLRAPPLAMLQVFRQ